MERELNSRQVLILKALTDGPKTTSVVFNTPVRRGYSYSSVNALRTAYRRLEDRGLVRAREKKDIIAWEITAKGRKAIVWATS